MTQLYERSSLVGKLGYSHFISDSDPSPDAKPPPQTIIDLIDRYYPEFNDPSWTNWLVFLKALFHLDMSEAECDTFKRYSHFISDSDPSPDAKPPPQTIIDLIDRALAGLELGLKDRHGEPLAAALEVAKRHIGELSMENELLRERARTAEQRLPLPMRRSRR